jgi:hypothetical protein
MGESAMNARLTDEAGGLNWRKCRYVRTQELYGSS